MGDKNRKRGFVSKDLTEEDRLRFERLLLEEPVQSQEQPLLPSSHPRSFPCPNVGASTSSPSSSQQVRRPNPSSRSQSELSRPQQPATPSSQKQNADPSSPIRIPAISTPRRPAGSSSQTSSPATPAQRLRNTSSFNAASPMSLGRRSDSRPFSRGSSPRVPKQEPATRATSAHVPGCRCQKCDPDSYITFGFGGIRLQWAQQCVPGCLCIFCLERKNAWRWEGDCRNEGHKLPDHKQCELPFCTCKAGCGMRGCPKCEPGTTRCETVSREVVPKGRISPRLPHDRGQEGAGSGGREGKVRQGGRGGRGQVQGGSGSGSAHSPHAEGNRLRFRRPSR